MWFVDVNYNFECDWLVGLSDNKLSDNNFYDYNNKQLRNGHYLMIITFCSHSIIDKLR